MIDNDELKQLGADLAGDFEVIKDDKPPKDPPPGDSRTTDPPGDKGEGGDPPPDPLADLTREQLLSHPVLGPLLQNWKDSDMDGRVQRVLERERGAMTEDARLASEEGKMASMEAEELGTYLQEDPSHRQDYANILARKDTVEVTGIKEEVEHGARILQIASTLRTYGERVKAANLPKEVLDTLNPEGFREKGIDAYQVAVDDALVAHGAQDKFSKELSKDLEAATQTELAKRDGQRRPADLTPGSATKGRPDLLETDASDLVASGLAQREQDRK